MSLNTGYDSATETSDSEVTRQGVEITDHYGDLPIFSEQLVTLSPLYPPGHENEAVIHLASVSAQEMALGDPEVPPEVVMGHVSSMDSEDRLVINVNI